MRHLRRGGPYAGPHTPPHTGTASHPSLPLSHSALPPFAEVATVGLNAEVTVRSLDALDTRLASLASEPLDAWHIAASPADGALFATGSRRGALHLLRLGEGGLARAASVASRAGSFATCVAFSPDGARAAAGHADGTISLIDVAAATLTATIDAHQLTVRSVAFSHDGSVLYTGADDARVGVYDVSVGGAPASPLVCQLSGHRGFVTSVAAAPAAPGVLASAGADKAVKVWDARKRECLHTFEGATGTVWAVAWAPSGTKLASVSESGGLMLHNLPA